MSADEITRILAQAIDGDVSEKVDLKGVEPEFMELARTVNTAIDLLKTGKEAQVYKKRMIAFVKNNPQAIAVLKADKTRIDLNKEYQRMWRGSFKELMSKKLYDFNIKITDGDDFYASFSTKKNARTDMEISWEDGSKTNIRLFQTPILNDNGDIDVNYYIYQDLTQEVALNNYLHEEVDRVAENIERISKGDLHLDLSISEGNEYTVRAREMILTISHNLETAKNVIEGLVTDVEGMTNAAIKGNLTERADPDAYEGQFHELIAGFNKTLDMISAPLTESMRVIGSYADNNYTARFSNKLVVYGDFEKFKESINQLGDKLVYVIQEVKKAVDNVNNGTTEISRNSDEVAKATEQVATSSQKGAEISRAVLTKMENVQKQISDLSASNQEIAATSQDVLKNAENMTTKGNDAQVLGNDANQKMDLVQRITAKSVTEINELNEQIQEINNIVKMINNIASQINLLSLNAAIEAARAGEHGRGFAVVAGEVKNLAADAKKATNHIDSVITSIRKNSHETADAIEEANRGVLSAVESVDATIRALNEIVTESQQVTSDMSEIARAIDDQANIANVVVEATDDSARGMSESLKESDELAALAQQTSASVEEIGSAIHEVNQMANSLTRNMNRFKIEK